MKARLWIPVLSLLVAVIGSTASEAQTLHRYWADLQGDNSSYGTPVDYYTFGRDSVGLDVVALTPHANTTTDTRWANLKIAAQNFYVPGSFVAFSGYEWNSDVYGHKPVYFLTDDQPIYRPNSPVSDTPDKFYALIAATNGVGHAAHPSLNSYTTNWNYFDPDLQPNAEIFSRWGTYETHPTSGKALRDVWARGYRVGVLASSDSHVHPGADGGLTAILATSLTRSAILDALRARHNYATNGARIGLDFRIGSAICGDMLNNPVGDAQIYARVEGTAPISRVEVRRSNQLAYSYAPPPRRVFVEVGQPLTYFKGTVDPPADWNGLAYDDAGWFAGRSGIGFGNNDDVTVITGMVNKYATLYTRQSFAVTDNAPQFLFLGCDYDDGFIAYIDGVEVLRANMPAGPVNAATLAATVRNPIMAAMAVPGATVPPFYTNNGLATGVPTMPAFDLFDLSAYSNLLTPGNHMFAVEIHNALLGSNDLSLIPRLYEVDPLTTATVDWTDTGVGGDRFYDVKVIQIDGGIAWSSPIWLNPDAPPRPVASLTDTPYDNGTSLELSWTKSTAPDFRYYNIYVSDAAFTDAGGMSAWNVRRITNADSLHATINSFGGAPLQRGKTYSVYVGAFDWADKMNSLTVGCLASAMPTDNIAPAAPGSITALDTPNDDGGSLRISWAPSADDGGGANDVQRYDIFRRKNGTNYTATAFATRPRGTTTFQDNTTLDGTLYLYKVRAHDGFNASPFTVEVGPITSINNGGLADPKNVTAVDRPNDQGRWIVVSWDLIARDSSITRYDVYRATTPGGYGGSPKGWVPRGIRTFNDSTAVENTDYYYTIVSDSAGARLSAQSQEAGPVQAVDNVPPPAVSTLTATNNSQGGTVVLNWAGYSEPAVPDLAGYNVYYKTSSFTSVASLTPAYIVAKGSFSSTVAGLVNNTTYYFAVAPVDGAGNVTSAVVSRSAKPTDTVPPTFSGLTSATPGDGSLTLGWNAARDNTLPITYNLYQSLTPTGFSYTTPTCTIAGSRPIVPMGASWRFLKGTSAPPTSWSQRGFDDNGWLAGEGAFGYDTGSRYQPATLLSDMNGVYTTVYFRANFDLTSIPNALLLGVLVDDGFIAYLNGVEVSRDNIVGAASYTTLAQTGINAAWSATLDLASPTNYNPNPVLRQIDLSAYTGLLVSGRNTLAFEVHNAKKTNADFLFLAELAEASVRYTVTGLSPSTTYYFVMRAADGAGNKDANTTVVSGRPLLAPRPMPVNGLTAVKSGSSVLLRWTPVATDSVGSLLVPDHYDVYRGTASGFLPDLAGHTNLLAAVTGTSYTDAGALSSATDLYYRVTAVSASGRESYGLSSLGLKASQNYAYQSGQQNQYWISIPYLSGMPDAQTLVNDLNHGPVPGPVSRIARFNPATQLQQSLSFETGAWVGDNFPIIAGEAYAITLQSSLTLTLVGAHNPGLGLNMSFKADRSNIYWLALPYHADYADAQSLLQHLNGGLVPAAVSKIVRLDPATGQPLGYLYFAGQWLGQNFSIQPGQGYGIVLRGDVSGWRPRVVR